MGDGDDVVTFVHAHQAHALGASVQDTDLFDRCAVTIPLAEINITCWVGETIRASANSPVLIDQFNSPDRRYQRGAAWDNASIWVSLP